MIFKCIENTVAPTDSKDSSLENQLISFEDDAAFEANFLKLIVFLMNWIKKLISEKLFAPFQKIQLFMQKLKLFF